jgi:dTDP-4-amino-4,6-dideoxygalactose transaminase
MMIPCAFPKKQYLPIKEEVLSAVTRVLESGTYILGSEVAAFELEFANYLGCEFAIGCGSGTDALILALRALDIGEGDEVIVPSHTATATIAAVVSSGAKPIYVDIDPKFYTLDSKKIEKLCNAKTKAIIAVHLYGQAAEIEGLLAVARSHNLRLIEDCAQATGATWRGRKLGTIGDVGCFSFFPTKNMGGYGDAGAIVCQDAALATRLKRLRQYGWDENRVSIEPGINSRLDEIQAAILRVKLSYLDADNDIRRTQAERYTRELAGLPLTLPIIRADAEHTYHLYVVRTPCRDELDRFMKQNDVLCGIHYVVPVHKMPAFSAGINLPDTEAAAAEILSLPLFPGLVEDEQGRVISLIKQFFAGRKR